MILQLNTVTEKHPGLISFPFYIIFLFLHDRYFMRPIECIQCHEIVCFRNVEKLQSVSIAMAALTNLHIPATYHEICIGFYYYL